MSFNLEDIVGKIKQVEDVKIQKEKGSAKGDPRILNMKKGNTYTLRLIPNIKDVDNTFVTWKEIGFPSVIDGKYIYCGRSPQDAGLKEDIFKTTQWNHYSKHKEKGDEAGQKASYKLLPQRKQAVNAYLAAVDGDDAESKEKVGQVVALRYPAQVNKDGTPISDIYKRIYGAIFGDMSKKIGGKALDLSAKGKSLIIKVTDKAGYNNYSETMFDDAEDLGLADKDIKRILDSAHDLNELVPDVLASEEAKKLLDVHWDGKSASADDELDTDTEVDEDDIDLSSDKKEEKDELDSLLDEA